MCNNVIMSCTAYYRTNTQKIQYMIGTQRRGIIHTPVSSCPSSIQVQQRHSSRLLSIIASSLTRKRTIYRTYWTVSGI